MGTKKTTLGTKNKPKKAIKGSVSIQKLNNTTRLKYRYQGEIYFLTIPKKANIPLIYVEQIRRGIETDILLQEHDNSQEKYKQWLQQKGIIRLEIQEQSTEAPAVNLILPSSTVFPTIETDKPTLDEQLMNYMEVSGRSDSKDLYHYTYQMVFNWVKEGKNVQWKLLPKLLGDMNYAHKTYNNRKFVLDLFCKWLVKHKTIDFNPFDDVSSKRKSSVKDPRRKRLTDDEINRILLAIKDDTYCKPHNRGFTHSHYYPIFTFLAHTGTRPAEAIGLLVKKVDFENKIITIDEAFARTRKGTSFACRQFKGTKTETSRELPFQNDHLLQLVLERQCKGRNPNDFVFPGLNSPICDDRKLNDTVLKTVIEGLKIPERVLYVFRHSFASRCFEQGMDIKSVQALTGHKDVTVLLNIYAEVNQAKVSLPGIPKQVTQAEKRPE